MGLSIHYSGEFKQGASLCSMIEEVKDIAELHGWGYHVFEENFNIDALGKKSYSQEIYGIRFTPPDCETVSIEFLSNGRMSSLMLLNFYGQSEVQAEHEYLYMISVKTQYAGIEIHKLIIHLFKYLSKKYFTNFKFSDEGQYWETGDEKLLQEVFNRYDNLINSFSSATEIYPKEKDETFESYFTRLISHVQKRIKRVNDKNL